MEPAKIISIKREASNAAVLAPGRLSLNFYDN